MTTAQDIISAAFGMRTANDPGLISPNEAIRRIERFIRKLYIMAAESRVPEFFGFQQNVAGAAGVWTIPATAILAWRVENGSGDQVHIVSKRDVDAEIAPRLYQLGSTLVTVGEAGDPSGSESLTMFLARRHPALDPSAAPDAAANQLDASWREDHNDLLVVDLALYMAEKDGREAEGQRLGADKDDLLGLFQMELRAYETNTTRRWR